MIPYISSDSFKHWLHTALEEKEMVPSAPFGTHKEGSSTR